MKGINTEGQKTAVNNSRTKKAKAQAQRLYIKANKGVDRRIKHGVMFFVENLAEKAVQAIQHKNMKELHDITRKLAGSRCAMYQPVKDKEGQQPTHPNEQLKRSKEHFEELLNVLHL